MALMAEFAWDFLTLIVSLAALFYLARLRSIFRGGEVATSFNYFIAAVAVFGAGFTLRVILDLVDVSPTAYGLSVRDPTIIAFFVLAALGLRSQAKVWSRK
jgi:hypothetical protein